MKNGILDRFVKEHEELVLSEENQELLQMHGGNNSDDEAVDPENDRCNVTNNCDGGNCVAGCGAK